MARKTHPLRDNTRSNLHKLPRWSLSFPSTQKLPDLFEVTASVLQGADYPLIKCYIRLTSNKNVNSRSESEIITSFTFLRMTFVYKQTGSKNRTKQYPHPVYIHQMCPTVLFILAQLDLVTDGFLHFFPNPDVSYFRRKTDFSRLSKLVQTAIQTVQFSLRQIMF